jgi:formylglycine-generating enzyme required for sulfatase activity
MRCAWRGRGVADVFISYKQDERPAIEQIATRLRALRLSVWFDASMSAGESFNDEIDREARAASAILVCWSPAARESRWVKAEAMIGFEQDKLVASYVAGPDGFSPPTPFNTSHAEDLRGWLAAVSDAHAGWKSVLRRIGRLCGRADIETWGALPAHPSAEELRSWIDAHGASPLFLAVDTLLRERETEEAERARLEQEARERRALEEAERRAQEEAERREQAALEADRQRALELAALGASEGNARAGVEQSTVGELGLAALGAEVALPNAGAKANASRDSARRVARRQPWAVIVGGGVAAFVIVVGLTYLIALNLDAPIYQAPQRDPAPILTAGQSAADLPPGSAFRDCAQCPDMVRIPGHSFAAGRYEVTFAQWDACYAAGGCDGYRPNDGGFGLGNRPVINVSWDDAQAYVRWLSQHTGQRYRLLTSEEWEIAARAGTSTEYSWGDQAPVCDQVARNGANFYGCNSRTLPVGSSQANDFGLYDVHGNVYEWVEDCYESSCSNRVVRGGSWLDYPVVLRSANRDYINPRYRFSNLGFRVARTL